MIPFKCYILVRSTCNVIIPFPSLSRHLTSDWTKDFDRKRHSPSSPRDSHPISRRHCPHFSSLIRTCSLALEGLSVSQRSASQGGGEAVTSLFARLDRHVRRDKQTTHAIFSFSRRRSPHPPPTPFVSLSLSVSLLQRVEIGIGSLI